MRSLLPVPLVSAGLALSSLGAAAPADATQVAYIDGDQVRVSTLDGSQKRSLSGPSPDEKQWREVAQGDDGTVIGVRREGSKMGTFNVTQLWNKDGSVRGYGALTAKPGRTSYAFPVTLDLTPDAAFVIYGYANSSGFGTGQSFEFGTYAEISSKYYLEPVDISPVEEGTLAGKRIVGVSGTLVSVQNANAGNPFNTDFTPWFDAGGISPEVHRVDVAANGTIASVETGDLGSRKVALIPFTGLGGPLPTDGSDCFLPAHGDARDVSFSQDGKTMAWWDDRGVVVAGTPNWFPSATASTCALSRPPVVISASGRMPSLGPTTAATPPVKPPPAKPAAPRLDLAKTVKAASLSKGVTVGVTVGAAGAVKVTGKVGTKTVAGASGKAKSAGRVALRLKATRAYRSKLRSLRGKTLVVTARAGGMSASVKRKLR